MKKFWLLMIVVALLVVITISFFLLNSKDKVADNTRAQDTSAIITSDSDWNSASHTKANIAVSSGSISINNRAPTQIDLSGMTTEDDCPEGQPSCYPIDTRSFHWQVDLGESMAIGKLFFSFTRQNSGFSMNIYSSDNATDWDLVDTCYLSSWGEIPPEPQYPSTWCEQEIAVTEGRYWKIQGVPENPAPSQEFNPSFNSYEIYKASDAVFIAAVDGGASFWEWQSFADTKTVPANTSVSYRYRTRADGDWTAWTADFGQLTSRTGDPNNPTLYRTLQIEATLANTDNSSSPTIDQIDIDYHTEVKPTAPSAQTAVAQ